MTIRYLFSVTAIFALCARLGPLADRGDLAQAWLGIVSVGVGMHLIATMFRVRNLFWILLLSIFPVAIISRLTFTFVPDLKLVLASFLTLPVVATFFWLTVVYGLLDVLFKWNLQLEKFR